MSDDGTQRYIGELSGLITSGFAASKERYEDMARQLDGIREDVKETNKAVKALDDCVDRRTDTIMNVMETQNKATNARLTTLEQDKAKVQGGWKALVVTWGGAVGASGAAIGAMKLLGFLK